MSDVIDSEFLIVPLHIGQELYNLDLAAHGLAVRTSDPYLADQVRNELMARFGEEYRVFIFTNKTLREEVLRIFDSTFAITYALEVIAIVVAMLGVAATLLTLVLERRRELSMLRLIGATRRQVQRMVVVEAALLGMLSQTVGLVVPCSGWWWWKPRCSAC